MPPDLRLEDDVLREVTRLSAEATLTRLAVFLTLYVAGTAGAVLAYRALVADGAASLAALAVVPFVVVAAASLHGISLFTHEGVHGVLAARPEVNRWLAVVCAIPVLQSFHAYRLLHLRHHRSLGMEDDPDHYENYAPTRTAAIAMYWGRLLLGYPAYIVMIPVLAFRRGHRHERRWILAEAAVLLSVTTTVAALVALGDIPVDVFLLGWALPMLVIHFVINVRGMSQHTGVRLASDPVLGSRTFLTSGLVRFFMCNEVFHLEHHLYPQVPWYHLGEVHQALRPALLARGAPFVPGYLTFVRDFVVASVKGAPSGTVDLGG